MPRVIVFSVKKKILKKLGIGQINVYKIELLIELGNKMIYGHLNLQMI